MHKNVGPPIGIVHQVPGGAVGNFLEREMENMGRWAERAKQLQHEAIPPTRDDMAILEVGKQVDYQIPVFECDKLIGWKKHTGTVELLDDVRQMVLVIPETESQPWRWIAQFCITKGTA